MEGGCVALSDVSHVDILSPSAPGPPWQPWSSDALETRRHKSHWLQVSAAWAYVPFGVWPVHVNTKWTLAHTDSTMNAASPYKNDLPLTHWVQTLCKPCPWSSSVSPRLNFMLLIWSFWAYYASSATMKNISHSVDLVISTYCISLTLIKCGICIISLYSCYVWPQAIQPILLSIMSRCWLMLEAFKQMLQFTRDNYELHWSHKCSSDVE